MNKEFFKKCWKHSRWHSLMVLLIWIVVLTLLMGIVSIINHFSSPKTLPIKTETKESSKISYEEMWNYFTSKDYAYTYTITKDVEIIKYTGTRKDGIDSGYRERTDGITKYSIENGTIYEVLINDKKEIETLYENVDKNYLNPTSVYEMIQTISANDTDILEEQEQTTYEYHTKIDEEDLKIVVITNHTQIKKIAIEKVKEIYALTFDFEE